MAVWLPGSCGPGVAFMTRAVRVLPRVVLVASSRTRACVRLVAAWWRSWVSCVVVIWCVVLVGLV